ncbi:MOSC domain-containing protein [Aureimonas leprariae]|uniref:MOSC domain-containing protein n=1 Tax=Plantimonas leprariae TaxID=2615207 RepID=A0A7V7PPT2_9HYPH|nr:MOSC domain-containing protein [Aureimonas leprariae]KAB0680049.1 MOSC domain-containing protein [Aureimonas leprariae]
MQVSALNVYPVKGARGVAMTRSPVELAGLTGDRRWMVVEPDGRFVTQRELPALALLEAVPDEDGLHLSFPASVASDGGERFVPVPDGDQRLAVRVWKDAVDAAAAGSEDDRALSRWLGRPLRLAHFDGQAQRGVSRDWLDRDAPVGFADGFPVLVATEASLRALNRTIVAGGTEAVPMNRFRPNVVIADTEAFEEDGWATIRVGDVVLDLVKPCARCTVTTVDQSGGVFDGPEPLASLTRLRMSGDRRAPGVLFGWNAVPRAPGEIAVGDGVEVLERREGGWPLRRPKAA